ncbi:MAG TPA: YciI family protein [Mucilaginibacter sp.]
MKEFLLLFRNAQSSDTMPSPEQLQNISKSWQDWFSSIAAQNKLSSRGNRLDFEGTTVRPNNVVTDGPYAEIKEIMLGYIVVKTNSLQEATELAKGCPVLLMGGNVEVRGIVEINM